MGYTDYIIYVVNYTIYLPSKQNYISYLLLKKSTTRDRKGSVYDLID